MRTATLLKTKNTAATLQQHYFYGFLSMNEVAPEVQTEEARLAELRIAYSLRPGFADGMGCNCLVDSLLQLLVEKGFFRALTRADRQSIAAANRDHLMNHPLEHVHPVQRDRITNVSLGKNIAAYLQAEIHAEPSIEFLFDYAANMGYVLQPRPAEGFRIIVYSRLDILT